MNHLNPCRGCFWQAGGPEQSRARWCAHKTYAGWIEKRAVCGGKALRAREPGQAPICNRCNVDMMPGTALASTTVVGMPDFPGQDPSDLRGRTLTDGPGQLVEAWKCPSCGRSITR